MEITNGQQVYELFLSCGMGFFLGAYYDIFRVVRLIMKSGAKTIFFQDILFFLSSAVFTFLFSLSIMDGELRFYMFFGLGVGFSAYYFTLGKIVIRFAGRVVDLFSRVWHFLWWLIFYPFRLVYKLLDKPLRFLKNIFRSIWGKIHSFFKKSLKRAGLLLYNQKKKIMGRSENRRYTGSVPADPPPKGLPPADRRI